MAREFYYEDPYLQTYERHLAAEMHLRPVEEEAVAPVRRVCRVLLMPAFHAESCITVREEERSARVELVAITPRFWGAYYQRDNSAKAPVMPKRIAEISGPIAALEQYHAAIGAVFDMIEPTGRSGMDGLPVRGWCVETGGRSRAFNVHSPTRELAPEAAAFVEALFRLADGSLVSAGARAVLDGLEAYLDV